MGRKHWNSAIAAGDLSETYGGPCPDCSSDSTYSEFYDFYKYIDHLNLDGAVAFDAKFFSAVRALGQLG